MQVSKMIPGILLGAAILALGVFYFVPSTRPGIVDGWFKAAQGYTPAKSAEDCLDQFKRAMEKRQYDVARDYLSGEYRELFMKGADDARELARGIDELADVMKTTGVKSDKVDVLLYWLDPFPAFRYEVKNKSSGTVMALIHWRDDAPRVQAGLQSLGTERYDLVPLMLHSLLPTGTTLPSPMAVTVKETDGVWKIEMPVQFGDRHVRNCVESLRVNATNYRNALQDIKQSIKNNPAVKEDFEREFKSNIEKAK
jgi:hypothetical protein